MISAVANNQPSFKSVVSVKVFYEGMEQTDPDMIRLGFKQLAKTLVGPLKGKTNSQRIAKKFSEHDPDYSIVWGITGYPPLFPDVKTHPSDYFRMIDDIMKTGKMFLVTGPQANRLKELGRKIGAIKANKLNMSFDDAKKEYKNYLNKILYDRKLRLREKFDMKTRERQGRPVELYIHLNKVKNGTKIYVDNIEFSRTY